MRTLLVMPLTIALAGALGWMICAAAGVGPHPREMLLAALTCLVASELAVVPVLLTRGASQYAVSQACLVGTFVHLFACVAVAGVLMVFKPLDLGPALVYWLLSFYWLTLIVLVTRFVRLMKATPTTAVPTTARQS